MATQSQIQKATQLGIKNAATLAQAATSVGIPYYVAVALMRMESMGENIWGDDRGGTFAGHAPPVTKEDYLKFRHLVVDLKHTSNGVGPAQITWRGFFPIMEKKGLKPWDVYDNMWFGLKLLNDYHKQYGTWTRAGKEYNGSYSYGVTFASKVVYYRNKLGK